MVLVKVASEALIALKSSETNLPMWLHLARPVQQSCSVLVRLALPAIPELMMMELRLVCRLLPSKWSSALLLLPPKEVCTVLVQFVVLLVRLQHRSVSLL